MIKTIPTVADSRCVVLWFTDFDLEYIFLIVQACVIGLVNQYMLSEVSDCV